MVVVDEQIQERMAEATRLTREGRLAEATAAIQRALGGQFGGTLGSQFGGPTPPNATITVEDTVIVEEAEAPSQDDPIRSVLRTPGPGTTTRRPRRSARKGGGLPGTPPGPAPTVWPGPFNVPTEGEPSAAPPGGRFVERSYANRAGTRSYKLYVPSGHTGQAVPVVVMLHGCTQNPDDFAAGTRMNALAEEHTFLVAYPAQTGNANMQKCWNWFKAADQQRGHGEPSIIAGITAEVVGEYGADPERVYVAGMSAGGAMAAILGAAYPDLYAAVGVHSGLPPGAAQDLPSAFAAMQGGGPAYPPAGANRNSRAGGAGGPVPLIAFHGDRDTTVHPSNADRLISSYCSSSGAGAGGGADGPAPLAAVRQGRVPGGHAYTRTTYRDAEGLATAEQWTVHGLGHAWSGGASAGSYTDPKGPDASAEMARFFLEHPRR